jgi:hypothetical protein
MVIESRNLGCPHLARGIIVLGNLTYTPVGGVVVVTIHGSPVAVLQPPDTLPDPPQEVTLPQGLAWKKWGYRVIGAIYFGRNTTQDISRVGGFVRVDHGMVYHYYQHGEYVRWVAACMGHTDQDQKSWFRNT